MNTNDPNREPSKALPAPEIPWLIPTLKIHLADGSTLVKACKAVQRGTAVQVSKWTGISTKTLARLADAGFIRASKPTPWLVLYYPGEIEEFIRKTEADPDFWIKVKRDAYITSRKLRETSKR